MASISHESEVKEIMCMSMPHQCFVVHAAGGLVGASPRVHEESPLLGCPSVHNLCLLTLESLLLSHQSLGHLFRLSLESVLELMLLPLDSVQLGMDLLIKGPLSILGGLFHSSLVEGELEGLGRSEQCSNKFKHIFYFLTNFYAYS